MSIVPIGRRPGRVPPHNLDAEESLLGAMLLSPDAIATAATTIKAEDFYKPAHGHMYATILALWSAGQPADPVTVEDQLRREGLLEQAGGGGITTTLQNVTPAISHAHKYAKTVRDYATLRRLIAAGGEIAELGYSTPEDIDAALDRAETVLFQVGDQLRTDDTTDMTTLMTEAARRIVRRGEGSEPAGINAGLTDLDDITGGLGPGTLVIVAARPAMGKSHLAAHIALHLASDGYPCYMASAEMSDVQMADRFTAATSGVSLETLRTGQLSTSHWDAVNTALSTYAPAPLYLRAATTTIASIRAGVRRAAARHHTPPVVIVDYLQLLTGARRTDNRQVEVADYARALKQIALDYGTQVIAMAQVNRNVEVRADKRPGLADLRESGEIEQSADLVIFIYRDDVYNPDSRDTGIVELHVAKNRHGRLGVAKVGYQPATGRYWTLDRRY